MQLLTQSAILFKTKMVRNFQQRSELHGGPPSSRLPDVQSTLVPRRLLRNVPNRQAMKRLATVGVGTAHT